MKTESKLSDKGRTYERTFVVAVPVERAWQAFADPKEQAAWRSSDRIADPESLAAFEMGETKIGPAELHKRLSWSQYHTGLEGWLENVVTFEEVASGTKITIVRSGWGDSEAWRHFAESTAGGWDEIICDLVLYLETGVAAARHLSFRSGLAATATRTGAGVMLTHVVPGGCAAQAGMRSGDILLWLNGAPVLSGAEVAFFVREHDPGTKVELEYARAGEVLHGRAPLSTWNFGGGEYVGHPGGYPKPRLTESESRV